MADSALVQQVTQEVSRLNETQLVEFLAYIKTLKAAHEFSLEAWLKKVDAFQEQLRLKYGDSYYLHVQRTLDEIREEA